MATMAKETVPEDALPITADENESFAAAFSDKVIRRGFIRKVYSILMAQLVVTCSVIAFFMYHEPSQNFLSDHPEMMTGSWLTSFILVIVISCFENARRKSPFNFILLSLFTLAMSVTLAFTATVYSKNEILIAAGITALICFSLTIFAFQTKWDFTVMGGMLYVSLIILIVFGLFSIIFRSHVMEMLYASAGALLFSLYLIYDTQLIIGGNHKFSISPEEYIFAALSLYLDIINIFLKVLRLLRN